MTRGTGSSRTPPRIVVALLAMLLAMSAGCARTPPEEALRSAVAGLHEAIEARDPAAVRDVLAEDFVGNDGLDREGARRMAALYLMRHGGIGATPGPLDIEMRGEHATVRFSVALTAGTRMLPDSVRAYEVETGWRLDRGDWRMTSARWTPVGG